MKLFQDIEDLPKNCNGSSCVDLQQIVLKESLHLGFKDGGDWFKVFTISEILQKLAPASVPYMLIAGNTAHGTHILESLLKLRCFRYSSTLSLFHDLGVYRRPDNIKLFIDINDVPDLRNYSISDSELVLGANNTLTETQKIFESVSGKPGFEYCMELAKHIDLVANVPVRNVSSNQKTILLVK